MNVEKEIARLDAIRKKILWWRVFFFFSSFVLGIFCAYLFLNLLGFDFWEYSFLGLLFFLFFFEGCRVLFLKKKVKNYQNNLKDVMVPYFFQKKFQESHYNSSSGVSADLLEQTSLILMGNIYESSDFLTFQYEDIPCLFSNVSIKKEQVILDQDGKRKERTTIFQGCFFSFSMKREFPSIMQILTKSFIGDTRNQDPSCVLEEVFLGDDTFQKMFDSYVEIYEEAFLSLDTLEKIKKFFLKWDGEGMFGFKNGKIYFWYADSFSFFQPSLKKISMEVLQDDFDDFIAFFKDVFEIVESI